MISKEQFQAFVRVQHSGVTNMYDFRTVSNISGLSREQIKEIMDTYDALSSQYNEVQR